FAKTLTDAHNFTGRVHFGTQDGIDAGKFPEREHGRLDIETIHGELFRQTKFLQLLSGHHQRGDSGEWTAGSLRNEWHSARSAWIDFEHINAIIFDGELNV